MDSKLIYKHLCESRKSLVESYGVGSGLHRHHIIPRHSGGADEVSNFTYLTVREHIIAHYLLWRIHRNPNDLRSMKMLGANISPKQRQLTGLFCRDSGIGIFSESYRTDKKANSERCRKSAETQKKLQVGTFNKEKRNEIASLGGKVGGSNQKKLGIGIHDPKNFKKNASLGGKAIKGMICVTNGKHRTRVKPENLEEYLSNGYWKGFTLSSDT
jgi:hypothetical protein